MNDDLIILFYKLLKFYDNNIDEVHIIFAGVPFLLFTMSEQQQDAETKKIKLSELRDSKNGKYAILRHDPNANANIWYI